MKITMIVAFPLVILWITASVAATEPFDLTKFKYNSSVSRSFDISAETSEAIVEGSEEQSSVAAASISQTSGLSVTTHASAGSPVSPSKTSSPLQTSPLSTSITLNAHEIQELSRILAQTTTVSSPSQVPQVTEQTTVLKTDASSAEHSTLNGSSTDDTLTNATSSPTTSAPDVVLSTKATKTYIDTIFKQSLAWLGDTYTLSIVVPILAGFLFAIVIIVTLVTFACIRRRCRRRRLRRKILPDSIRKMGPSDRARLLAETSDEEF